MEIQLHQFSITKSDLEKLDEAELHFFLLLTGLANEIAIVTKLSVYTGVSVVVDGSLESNCLALQAQFLHKLMAAKLYEAYELLRVRFFGAKVSATYKDDKSLCSIVDEINSYFGKDNLIEKIRHDYSSHHYDEDKTLLKYFKGIKDEYELTHYTDGRIANTFHYGSQEIEYHAMLSAIGPIDPEEERIKTVLVLRDEVLDKADLIGKFVQAYFNACIQKHFVTQKNGKKHSLVKRRDLKLDAYDLEKVHIPFFTHVDQKYIDAMLQQV